MRTNHTRKKNILCTFCKGFCHLASTVPALSKRTSLYTILPSPINPEEQRLLLPRVMAKLVFPAQLDVNLAELCLLFPGVTIKLPSPN